MYAQDLRRSPAELQDALRAVDALPGHLGVVQGARAALEWLTGETTTAPVSRRVLDPADSVLLECSEAAGAELGLDPAVDARYARGAEAVLMWAMDRGPLPDYLRASAA